MPNCRRGFLFKLADPAAYFRRTADLIAFAAKRLCSNAFSAACPEREQAPESG